MSILSSIHQSPKEAILQSFNHPDPIDESFTPDAQHAWGMTSLPTPTGITPELLKMYSTPKPKAKQLAQPIINHLLNKGTKITISQEELLAEERLRQEEDSAMLARAQDPVENRLFPTPIPILVTFYSDGFTVNNSRFVPKSEPKHDSYLRRMKSGFVLFMFDRFSSFPEQLLPDKMIGDVVLMMCDKHDNSFRQHGV
ncbi:hypothetical protein BLNAU_12232 [Blattamonas nauphoetae]|uniref:SEP domain-containing protein n=1 Tax=Blattamonas nauphoetae TaxID=2049346 RepID=A0ABQ9XPN4_9EUKA|nr:hypothetical protein BLNAU_12232 [Blattamonas nauphoetae]